MSASGLRTEPLYWERVRDGAVPPPAVGAELTAKITRKRVRLGAWQWHEGDAYRPVWRTASEARAKRIRAALGDTDGADGGR